MSYYDPTAIEGSSYNPIVIPDPSHTEPEDRWISHRDYSARTVSADSDFTRSSSRAASATTTASLREASTCRTSLSASASPPLSPLTPFRWHRVSSSPEPASEHHDTSRPFERSNERTSIIDHLVDVSNNTLPTLGGVGTSYCTIDDMDIDDEDPLSDTEEWAAPLTSSDRYKGPQDFAEASQCDGSDVVSGNRGALPCLSVAADPPSCMNAPVTPGNFLAKLTKKNLQSTPSSRSTCIYYREPEQYVSDMPRTESSLTVSTMENCTPEPDLQRLIPTRTQPTTTPQLTVYAESHIQADTAHEPYRSVALGTVDKVPGSQNGRSLPGVRRNPLRCTRQKTTITRPQKYLPAPRVVSRRGINRERQPERKSGNRTTTTRRRAKVQAGLEALKQSQLDDADLNIAEKGGQTVLTFSLPSTSLVMSCPQHKAVTPASHCECFEGMMLDFSANFDAANRKYPFKRLLEKRNEFLVEWETGEMTWEPEVNFDCKDIEEFEKRDVGFGPGVESILGSRKRCGRA
ncbi:uncharacterized protein B0I36DRAFT_394070 [Microdochium trichocladiopsis]|uniref:Chromo domain-containing protein n=1 Tax=Microdochium trichocladiopsis TaxID=1682393 RepID=A0A9P9BKS6_9PEZI|nr:uncharacterized protein B0I36DRAFT_394070 [Microdochium trichocladiopsis]KAH7021521.1 hypothetical protein B0I36DRAFT_394070 [Microdochium trichocladiopsis]